MKRTWLAAVAFLGLAGCSVRTTHTLVANAYEVVPSGTCATDGPYPIPGGASMTYDITDFGDDMDVGFTSVADGCDLTNGGAAVESNTYWGGSLVETVDNVPPDSYYFVMNCYNLDGSDCVPT